MHHLVVLRLDLRHGHIPAVGRFLLQHLPDRGGHAAQRHEMMAHAARAVGVLVAVARLVALRLQDVDARHVGFQLVGDDRRPARADALTHLGPDAQQVDGAVIGDREDEARIFLDPALHAVAGILLVLRRRGRDARGEDEGAGGESEDERAAAEVAEFGSRGHGQPPCAARLMAARMRG
jgi:hypothetical protein